MEQRSRGWDISSELQVSFRTGVSCYFLIRSATGTIWNGVSFGAYASGSYSSYPVNATEQGAASGYYVADFPSTIVPGVYSIVAKVRAGGSPAESDTTIAEGDFQWSGTVSLPLSDLATSGQIGQFSPIRVAKRQMIKNFPIYLKSSADHITPFTSGVVSGQIARDGGGFNAFQSGAFTEVGLGWYNLQAVTSGDVDADWSVKMNFSANGISGGAADPLPMSFILQRTSGVG